MGCLQPFHTCPLSPSGGFKLWEGSVDLCKALCKEFKIDMEMLSSGHMTGELEVSGDVVSDPPP
jgi:hypothetical protein